MEDEGEYAEEVGVTTDLRLQKRTSDVACVGGSQQQQHCLPDLQSRPLI